MTEDRTSPPLLARRWRRERSEDESDAVGRAERDLKALIDRAPRIVHRRIDERIEDIRIEDVAVGDLLLARAGEVASSWR
ncbi:hypothetical protein CQW49_08315 [Methylosinus trichosporium OB3b]|uniref:Uncharacterized protein n=1 Tax=Methylosinus trichosporium (strain ATCC 35070 / NCIMB 11131 / UNIQEM 75 / OB3b) TaxID=595536 RepID=A0A2D2CYT3_METT3|nr:hypothetical protein CQW49_08315 [Methylosinus trichosporium OB3b]OBS54029.1 hypothetical protein A8B73_02810 [Methylosinus sp. 3S-1]